MEFLLSTKKWYPNFYGKGVRFSEYVIQSSSIENLQILPIRQIPIYTDHSNRGLFWKSLSPFLEEPKSALSLGIKMKPLRQSACLFKTKTISNFFRKSYWNEQLFIFCLFFYLSFLPWTLMIHRTAGEGGGYLCNSSLPLPPALKKLRQSGDSCRELTSAHS